VDAADAVTAEPVPGGWEFAATFGIMVLVLGAVGPGRLSADAVIARTRPAR
jgi:uncharacterized membrane protein YphA (DoxX/SURF4 family)